MSSTNEVGRETAPGAQRHPALPLFERPRLRTRGDGSDQTTWLELFADLVFIVGISQVAQRLAGPLTARGVLGYVALSIPLWWAWVGFVFYADRFGTDDLGGRLLTLAQMGAAIALAATVRDGLEARSAAFALAYVAFRAILVVRYLLAAHFVVDARALARHYARGFALAALLWLASVWVAPPWRIAVWGAALLVDFGTPLTQGRRHAQFAPDHQHLQERFGTLVIIVMGQGTIGIVQGVRDAGLTWRAGVLAGLVLAIGFAMWWVYFEALDGSPIAVVAERGRTAAYQTWLYAHLPLGIGVSAFGMGGQQALDHAAGTPLPDPARWLLAGSAALCFAMLAVLDAAYAASGSRGPLGRRQASWRIMAAVSSATIALFGRGLSAVPVMLLLALATLPVVPLDLAVRRRAQRDARHPARDASG